MTAIDFIRDNMTFVHRGFRQAANGLTKDQLHFVPPGQSHSIAWIMWHTARIEDMLIHQVFQAQPAEFKSGSWAEKTGLPEKGFGTGQSTEDAANVHIRDLDAFNEYRETVFARSDAFLASLTDDDLTREVQLGEKTETLGESINLHLVTHLNGHRGEVNLLRGMMGFDPVMTNLGG